MEEEIRILNLNLKKQHDSLELYKRQLIAKVNNMFIQRRIKAYYLQQIDNWYVKNKQQLQEQYNKYLQIIQDKYNLILLYYKICPVVFYNLLVKDNKILS